MYNNAREKGALAGMILCGSLGKYKLLKEVGQGGNGIVYSVDVVDGLGNLPSVEKGFVVKILTLTRFKDEKKKANRRSRFKREIIKVNELQNSIEGIIPVVDYSFGDNDNGENDWYLMPKAEEYKYWLPESLYKKLEQMGTVAETLRNIHELGFAHRDIKPSNLLYYKGHVCISDFGLVWSIDEEGLTLTGEHIGPYNIRPPELEGIDHAKVIDYQKSDIYLFAKTLWIALTKNSNGFYGEYKRGDKQIYIDKSLYGDISSLEPIHLLMEQSTRQHFNERIEIDECICLMKLQMDILRGQINPSTLRSLQYEEAVKKVNASIDADVNLYKEPSKILMIMNELSETTEITASDFGENYSLGVLKEVTLINDDLYQIATRRRSIVTGKNETKKYLLSIKSVQINGSLDCQIAISRPSSVHAVGKKYTNLMDAINSSEETVCIDGSHTVFLNIIK